MTISEDDFLKLLEVQATLDIIGVANVGCDDTENLNLVCQMLADKIRIVRHNVIKGSKDEGN